MNVHVKNDILYEEIDISGYRSALDSLHCAAIILNSDNILYSNYSAKQLFERCHLSYDGFLKELKAKINLDHGKGRFSFVVNDIRFVCNVYPWMEGKVRKGSTLILHDESHPDCAFMEMQLMNQMLREMDTILETAYDGMIVTNQEGSIVRVNTAAEGALGVQRKDMIGRKTTELVDAGIYDCSAVAEVLRTGASSTVVITAQNGKTLLATGMPIPDEEGKSGESGGVVVNLRDLSELNDLRQKLEHQQMVTEAYQRQLSRVTGVLPKGIVAESPEMIKIFDTVRAISDVDSTVLITGESGVGKEVVVNYIHSTSKRSEGPFIKVNCGAIPMSLFESEMFGYAEGAFTGAKKRGKAGFFELADGGTLFLDEIGELDMNMQVKILRVIQERELIRVGAESAIKVDVRIIAATNRDLWEMVQEGNFRQDLYYRLNVIGIHVPPLRERRDDIIPLAISFVEKYNNRFGKHKVLTSRLANVLRSLEWTGNIRELENVIENLVVLQESDRLLPEHLPSHLFKEEQSENGITVNGVLPLKEAVFQTERQLFRNASQRYSSTRAMAKALGVNQSTVVRKQKLFKDEGKTD